MREIPLWKLKQEAREYIAKCDAEHGTGGLTMDELKPCPFCGGENLEVRNTTFVGFTVRCWNDLCLASGPYKGTKEEAIEAWNSACRKEF